MGLRAPTVAAAPQPKAPLPEFDVQRKKVEQRIAADTQGQQDAMARRFAASGMLNSGAAIKQQDIVANQAQVNREDALGQVDAAETGEQQRRQEIADAQNFQAAEAQKGRDIQTQQFGQQFDLSKQQFGADRADQQRNIAASIANLKDSQLDKYNRYLVSQGVKPVPVAQPASTGFTFGFGGKPQTTAIQRMMGQK